MNKADQLSIINMHIKNMEDRCQQMQIKILTDEKLTSGAILVLRKEQEENQAALQWLFNIKGDAFRTLAALNGQGGGMIHGK